MKTYIVYKRGIEVGLIKARSHNSAEAKAIMKYGEVTNESFGSYIQVVYTEL
jgi:hypothetical protein